MSQGQRGKAATLVNILVMPEMADLMAAGFTAWLLRA
jgi:hypothetical protein